MHLQLATYILYFHFVFEDPVSEIFYDTATFSFDFIFVIMIY